MRKSMLSAALFGLLLTFSACKKDSPLGSVDGLNTIPATAAMVMAIDVPSLMEKADYATLNELEMYQNMLSEVEEENGTLRRILENPSKSGIDLEKHAYLAVDIDPENIENVFFGFVFSVADPDAFATMVESGDEQLTFTGGDGFQYATALGNGIVAYNDTYAILGGGSNSGQTNQWVANWFSTTEETSVTSNSNLRKAMKKDHDVSVWLTTNPFADNPEAKFALSMAEIDPEALKDNFIHAYYDFEDGEMIAVSEFDLQSALTKDIDKLFDDEVETDFSAYVPQEGLIFAFSTAISFKGIDEVLSARPQTKGFVDYGLQEYGLSVADIANTLGGDILVAATLPEGESRPAGLFAMNITDDEIFNRILGIGLEAGELEADGDGVFAISGSMDDEISGGFDFDVVYPDGKPRLIYTDDMIFITGHPGIQAIVENGGYPSGQQAKKKVTNMLFDHIFGAYAAMDILSQLEPDMQNNIFETLEATVNRKEGLNRMILKDDSQNSLRVLLEWINEEYKKEKANESGYNPGSEAM